MSQVVSSTPYPKRSLHHHIYTDIFDTEPLSPIVQPGPSTALTSSKPKINPVNPATKSKRVIPGNKKNEAKESASNVILKELGGAGKLQRTNLSQSRNLYNMHPPELIIVDSDEEDTAISTSQKPPQVKKKIKVPKPSTKRLGGAAGTSTQPCTNSNTDEEDTAILTSEKPPQVNKEIKVPKPSTKRLSGAAGTSTQPCTNSNTEPNGNGRDVKKITRNTSAKKRSPVRLAKRYQALASIENIQPAKIAKRSKKASITEETFTIVIDSEEDGSKLSQLTHPNNPVASQQRKCRMPFIEELSEDEIITFTPRSIKNGKSKVDKAVIEEESCNEKDRIENNVESSRSIRNKKKICDKNPPAKKCSRKIIENKSGNSCPEKETHHMKNTLPKGCVSRFEDIVFRPNKYTGSVSACSLKTDNLNFGYVEIEGDFTGTRSNMTFVVLQGQVIARLMGAVQELSPGDILHVSTGSGYKFENTGDSVARLLYIKENDKDES